MKNLLCLKSINVLGQELECRRTDAHGLRECRYEPVEVLEPGVLYSIDPETLEYKKLADTIKRKSR